MERAKFWSPTYGLDTLKRDLFGGGVAAVLMIPEALGFGALSGLGPLAALYGAIILSFIVAVLGGASPMISGPSAIVTIFTAVIVSTYANTITEALTIIALSGMIQIASARCASGVSSTGCRSRWFAASSPEWARIS